MGTEGIVIVLVVLAVLIRFMAGLMDRDRVRRYVHSRGGRAIGIDWKPFGRGWFGEKGDRIYEVRYVDANGDRHVAHCKTSMWSGVYFTDDRVVRMATRTSEDNMRRLSEENRQLREQIERVKTGEA